MPKYVVSRTLEKLSWNNSRLINGNVAEEVSKLKQQPGQDILIAGSADLVNLLMRYDLIDEYRLMVHPVILGSGKRLFNSETDMEVLCGWSIRRNSTQASWCSPTSRQKRKWGDRGNYQSRSICN